VSLYKELTVDNWLAEEHVLETLRTIGGDFDAQRWAARVLALELSPNVTMPLRDLFGVARGVLLYGCFFYPLFTLAFEQVLRVAEAAVDAKCKAMADPTSRTYADQLAWLEQQLVIRPADARHWSDIRELRNSRSHPDMQMLITPGNALE
jgi:hypothetical protein